MLIIISLIIIFFAIALPHELGHFICAKRAGIRVYEFAIGFGPRLFSFKKNNTLYALNLFPIAGYVRLAGTNPEDPDEANCPENEKYYNKSMLARFITIVAGSLSNLLVAFLIFVVALFAFGIPDKLTNEVAQVMKNSVAEKIGLLPGDKILSINAPSKIKEIKAIVRYIHENPNKPLSIEILRIKQKITIRATPKYDPKQKMGMLGFQLKAEYRKVPFFESIKLGAQQLFGAIVLFFYSLYLLGTLQAGVGDLLGPVGIAKISVQSAQAGIGTYLNLLGFIMASVGMFNLIPVPPLDGGHVLFILIEKIRQKAVALNLQARINNAGMVLLLGFMAIVTLRDIFSR